MSDPITNTSKDNSTIVRVDQQDLPALCNLLEMVAQWLATHGMHHWRGFYTTERVSQYFHEREIYCMRSKNEVIGTVTLNAADKEPGWYSNVPAIYVNALAVSPSHHGHGIGSSLLRYAEEVALKQGYTCMRLDAVADFHWLSDFYKKRGYQVVGNVQRRFHYFQYEKILDGADGLGNKT